MPYFDKDEAAMGNVLSQLGKIFSREYREIKAVIAGETRNCFEMENGVIFEIVGILPFNCVTVSYADNLAEAKKGWFDEGDQFDAWQDFDTLVREIREELKSEEEDSKEASQEASEVIYL